MRREWEGKWWPREERALAKVLRIRNCKRMSRQHTKPESTLKWFLRSSSRQTWGEHGPGKNTTPRISCHEVMFTGPQHELEQFLITAHD